MGGLGRHVWELCDTPIQLCDTLIHFALMLARETVTDQVFASLRANDLIWPYVVNSYLKGQAPAAFDLLYWNSDSTNLPGPMFCWYVRNTYLENNLREPGKTIQCDIPVDLSTIDMPTYVYASHDDHIVPWRTAYTTTELVGGEVTFVLGASGHIAGVINPPAKKKRNYWTDGELGADADDWLSTAQSVSGSWWPHWTTWLGQHSGAQTKARRRLGNKRCQRIEPAPGGEGRDAERGGTRRGRARCGTRLRDGDHRRGVGRRRAR